MISCLKNEQSSFEDMGQAWINQIKNAICRSFRKIRNTGSLIDKELSDLFDKRSELKQKLKDGIDEETNQEYLDSI